MSETDAASVRKLWLAVINQAVFDAFAKEASPTGYRISTHIETRQAVTFLTSERGLWAESRRTICDLAGIDADKLRTACLAMTPETFIQKRRSLMDTEKIEHRKQVKMKRKMELETGGQNHG